MPKALGVLLIPVLLFTLVGAAAAGNGAPINRGSANTLTLAVYGDAPYGAFAGDQAEVQATPAFIDSINRDPKVDLVVHVGDIHSGSDHCSAAYDQTVAALWQQYKDPLVYTPGDNEWTDCQKAKEGGWSFTTTTPWPCLSFAAQTKCDGYADPSAAGHYPGDPLDNLTLVRSLFFPTPGVTLGGRKQHVLSQSQWFDPAYPTDANYVENVMWEESQVLFVTLNIPGGSNNDDDAWFGAPKTSRQIDEVTQRTGADLRWLQTAFAQAKLDGVQAVVIIEQADMWDLDGKVPTHLAGYAPLVNEIKTQTLSYGKAVLLFNGDSHVYKADNPFANTTTDYASINAVYGITTPVPNFQRVVVHGSTFPLEWLKVTVDPRSNHGSSGSTGATAFGPFSWERVVPTP